VNLTTGAIAPLSGFGALSGAALGADGNLYTVAWRPDEPTLPMTVLTIDPTSLSVVASSSLGLASTSNLNIEVQSNDDLNALIFVSQGSATTAIASYLWSDSAGALKKLVSLPPNVGLYMQSYSGEVYLYGGPALNQVSTLDLSDDSLTTDVPGLAAPSDTYVLALE
jgi:hypothetical protein